LLQVALNTIIPTSVLQLYVCYMCGLAFYSHIEITCMTASFHSKREVLPDKLSLLPPLCFIEVPVPSQESERSYTCKSWNCRYFCLLILQFSTEETLPGCLYFL
jgi:hypothetical protein